MDCLSAQEIFTLLRQSNLTGTRPNNQQITVKATHQSESCIHNIQFSHIQLQAKPPQTPQISSLLKTTASSRGSLLAVGSQAVTNLWRFLDLK